MSVQHIWSEAAVVPHSWQFSSTSQETSGLGEWRTSCTKSVTVPGQWAVHSDWHESQMFRVVTSVWGKAKCLQQHDWVDHFLKDCSCKCVCVYWRHKKTDDLSSTCFNVTNTGLCVPARSPIWMLSSSRTHIPLIIHIELLKTCHVLITKHITFTKCSFEEQPI